MLQVVTHRINLQMLNRTANIHISAVHLLFLDAVMNENSAPATSLTQTSPGLQPQHASQITKLSYIFCKNASNLEPDCQSLQTLVCMQ